MYAYLNIDTHFRLMSKMMKFIKNSLLKIIIFSQHFFPRQPKVDDWMQSCSGYDCLWMRACVVA